MPDSQQRRRPAADKPIPQHRRSLTPYIALTTAGFVVTLILVWLLLWQAETLAAFGLTGKLFFIILIPLGLASALVLFGILRSFAHYSGKQLGGTLELGGPVIVFVLVLWLGFQLAPDAGNFPLTVYVHGPAGSHELVLKNSGYVMLDLGGERRREPIGDKGQALFAEIPASFRGQSVKLALDAEGYELGDPQKEYLLDGPSLYLPVQKVAGHIVGRVQDQDGNPLPGATVSVAGLATVSDPTGHFEITIPRERMQKEFFLQATAAGFATWHANVVAGGGEVIVNMKRNAEK